MVVTYPVIYEPVVTNMTFLSVTPTGAKRTGVFWTVCRVYSTLIFPLASAFVVLEAL
jgi:hypothetical protein